MAAKKETMSEGKHKERQEAALLDAVRLGLSGDARSLRQRVRNMLRTGSDPLLSDEGRRYLQDLLSADDDLASLRSEPVVEQGPAATPPPGEAIPVPDAEPEAPSPVLDHIAEERVARLIREYQHRHLLEEANLAPSARVLLSGPPGGGKTMTARFIARQLGLPLMLAEPSRVLTGVMGQSARNLSVLMRSAAERPCVLFLDELDAYARRRGETQDIAEAKRLVNTLLLELDRWPSHGLLIGATNHPEVLDEAVRRRFEMTIELGFPSEEGRLAIIADVVRRAGRDCSLELLWAISLATKGKAGSELVNDAVSGIRRSIIDEIPIDDAIGQQFFAARFRGRGRAASQTRRLAVEKLSSAGWSPEKIAPLLDVQPRAVREILESSNSP
jgi:SpoVK/Ycf46/Vps4 family AAA+-type ATPase